MLLSLEKKFIFIHIPKTAGTSIMAALEPWSLPPVKKTPLRRVLSHLPLPEAVDKAFLRKHIKAAKLRHKLPAEIYDGSYKFAVVRNPFDLAVSLYHYRRKHPDTDRHLRIRDWDFRTFARYLQGRARYLWIDQSSWIVDRRNRLIVDEVMRFERLAEEFPNLLSRLDVPPVELPRANATTHDQYRAYYDEESKAIVQKAFARDFERFGYKF